MSISTDSTTESTEFTDKRQVSITTGKLGKIEIEVQFRKRIGWSDEELEVFRNKLMHELPNTFYKIS
jgi:hypothetical protein